MLPFSFLVAFLPTVNSVDNVALGKPAQQVSEYSPVYPATKAVDGNTDGNFSHGFCTHTMEPEAGPTWWKVDLMGFYKVTGLEIFTRTDCCGNRLQNFETRVAVSNPTTFPSSEGQQCFYRSAEVPGPGFEVNCTQPVTGRFVSLYKSTYGVLTICELRVFAERAGVFAVRDNGSSRGGAGLTFLPAKSVIFCDASCFYSAVLENARLVGQVQRSLHAASAARCAQSCSLTVNCFSFNFLRASTSAKNNVTCELLGFVTFVAFQDWSPTVSQENGWKVYAMRQK